MFPMGDAYHAAIDGIPAGDLTSYGGWAYDQGPMDRVDHAVLQVHSGRSEVPARLGATGCAGAPSTFSRRTGNTSYLPAFLLSCPDPTPGMSHLLEKL